MALSLYQLQNYRLVQIQNICRRQINHNSKVEMCAWKGKTHCGKGENAGYQHFLIYPEMF